ncbi:hypothetical protein [Luteitalea sp.]|uniref:hypothetical protein n=1 Tax=Luteitalea sp. TaxID=2004800 RepID=UPI0025BB8197|nr:hypothetical protein [Luteitalea sp.]
MTMKIESLVGEQPQAFAYGDIFAHEDAGGHARLCVGVDGDSADCVATLARTLLGPFQVLYVLHTTRTGAALARYESPVLSQDELRAFLRRFGSFLNEDSRHDLWVRSHDDDATLVLDRHGVIYAYGPLGEFEAALRQLGIRESAVVEIPCPHIHHYHATWDDAEEQMLRSLDWTLTPLPLSDEQFVQATSQHRMR